MTQIADWLAVAAWTLAIGAIPGMAIGLIPWDVFGAAWGAALAGLALRELLDRPGRARPRPAFRNHSLRSRHPSHLVQRLPLP